MPKLSDLLNQFRQSRFGRALAFNSPDAETPEDAREIEPGVLEQLGGRLKAQYEALAGPGSPWQRGDLPGMAYQALSILNPIEGRNLVQSSTPSEAVTNAIPYFGGAVNEIATAQGQGRPNEATAMALEQLLNVGALKAAHATPGVLRAAGNLPTRGFAGETIPLRAALAGEEGMVPFELKPYKGGPEAIKLARNPKEAFEARIGQVTKRKPGVGAQKNERTVLVDSQGRRNVVGLNEPQDQANLLFDYIGDNDKIWDAALWYDKMAQELGEKYDIENVDAYKLAFALTQASNSPMAGIRDVLTAERLAGGQPEPALPAANAEGLRAIFEGRAPSSGIGQKISEFIDNLFGKKTRTQMNDDPRFGAPVTGDRWDFRAQGYVDYAEKQRLMETYGDQAKDIKLDTPNDPKYSGRVTAPQFENMVRLRNEQVKFFNDAKIAGHSDWTTERIQAAVWAAKKIQSGAPPMAIKDMFALYFSKVPMELAWGDNSPYSQYYPDLHQLPWEKNTAITNHVLPKLAAAIGERVGVRVIATEPVSGTFETYVNPNVEFTIFGTEKARQDWIQAMSHAANQTAGIAYHLRPKGEGAVGVYDLSAESPLAIEKLQDRAFLAKYLESLQAKHPKFISAEVLQVDGRPTIRIANTTPDFKVPTDTQGNEIGHYSVNELAAMDAAAEATAREFGEGFDTSSTVHGADIHTTFNDWKGNPNGEAHLADFKAENRQGLIDWLEGPLRGEAAKWIEEGFQKHAPDTWNAHFGKPVRSPGGAAPAAKPGAGVGEIYKPALLGQPSSVETFSRGWIMPDGKLVQVPAGGTHETSLAAVTGTPVEDLATQYPAYAAKGNLIRFTGHMSKSGYELVAELFRDPTNAQVKALEALQKHHSEKTHLYDQFMFILKDPLTGKVMGGGNKASEIPGTIRQSGFDIPF